MRTRLLNSVAMIDADGLIFGVYRKSHIPNDVGYQEKQYFSPGDTGFKVWNTRYGKIGVGICWDQWFPEAARCTALMAAEMLLYPTAIGSELAFKHDSMPHWRTVMQGHAAANIMPVIASIRIGTETASGDAGQSLNLYGSSFICDYMGLFVGEVAITDWNFNGWGSYPEWAEAEGHIPHTVAGILELPVFVTPIISEVGANEVNGSGSLIATRSSIINNNRNPDQNLINQSINLLISKC